MDGGKTRRHHQLAGKIDPLHFDVIVIGSGPAGCAAAIYCKLQGLHVAMITDKDATAKVGVKEARPSESIHPGVIPLLSQLNAAHCVDVASQGLYEAIAINGLDNNLGSDEYGAWQGHHIDRKLFDETLLSCAIDQTVNVLDKTVVEDVETTGDHVSGVLTKSGVRFTCTWLIDASGYKCSAGKKSGLKEVFYSPPLVVWTGVSESMPLHHSLFEKKAASFIPHSNGWTWLAPDLHGRCTWTRLQAKGKQDYLPPAELKGYPLSGKIKKTNRRWRVFRPVCKEGLLLCGDAAGIIDPAAGMGILNALLSGIMAARTVKSCMGNPDFTALYLARYDSWFIDHYVKNVNQLKHFYKLHGITIFLKKISHH